MKLQRQEYSGIPHPCYKVPFKTPDEAREKIAHVHRREGKKVSAKVRVYRCPNCGQYHWGHTA